MMMEWIPDPTSRWTALLSVEVYAYLVRQRWRSEPFLRIQVQ